VRKKSIEKRIILASASPRRRLLLKGLLKNFGLKFVVKPANIAEYIPKNCTNFGELALSLAYQKAAFIALRYKGIVIGADTIVVLKGKILGKPATNADAFRMLKMLSGKSHLVYTGLVMIDLEKELIFKTSEKTDVKFRRLDDREIRFYVRSGSPMDKAGAYGIQDDLGSTFVEKITGDYFNVVGLPIVKTYLGLKKFMGSAL
jgi:septum formation protein